MNFPFLKNIFKLIFACLCLTLQAHASFEEENDESIFLLMHAAMQGDIDIIEKTLLERGGINTRAVNDLTALHYAILYHQEQAALFLIENGANILACDRWGNTPLILAQARNLAKTVEALEHAFSTQYPYFNTDDLRGSCFR